MVGEALTIAIESFTMITLLVMVFLLRNRLRNKERRNVRVESKKLFEEKFPVSVG